MQTEPISKITNEKKDKALDIKKTQFSVLVLKYCSIFFYLGFFFCPKNLVQKINEL